MELTAEQAKLIREKQVANALAQVGYGHRLTRDEQKLIDGIVKPKGRIFENLDQAASILGTTKAALQKSKRLGCLAFRNGNKIDETILRDWLSDPANAAKLIDVDDKPTLELRKLSEQIRAIKLRNDKLAGLFVLKADCVAAISRCLGEVDRILEMKLCDEYPTTVFGLPVAEIRIFGKRLGDSIRSEFQKLSEHWQIEK